MSCVNMPADYAASADALQLAVPLDRPRAFLRFCLWGVPAAVLIAFSVPIYTELDFKPTAVSNGAVQVALALLASPLPIIGVICAWQAVRFLLLAAWPSRLGVFAGRDKLVLRLGPFGTQQYASGDLDIRYPFELLADDDEEVTFEAYLPQEEQREKFLPRITDRMTRELVGRNILRHGKGTEADIAARLRPFLELWRTEPPALA